MSVLSIQHGKVAWRDALVKEVCWLTGSNPEARIPTSMRKQPGTFFAMWEHHRSKASKLINLNKKKDSPPSLLTLTMPAYDGGMPEPGASEASGTSASAGNGKFMLASLLVDDKIAKSKRIPVPATVSDLRKTAVATFGLPEKCAMTFEVLDASTKDRQHAPSCIGFRSHIGLGHVGSDVSVLERIEMYVISQMRVILKCT